MPTVSPIEFFRESDETHASRCADILRALNVEAVGIADDLEIDQNKALFLLTQIYAAEYGGGRE